jgi:hypothetical protein
MITYKKKTEEAPIVLQTDKGVPYFYFPILEDTGIVRHGFSTRLGGVSSQEFSTMNFATTRGDSLENVKENYRRIAKAIGIDWQKIIVSFQTHTTNVMVVREEDAGKGITKERGYDDIDGFITDVPGIPLVTLYADCVPLYFLDPVKKVIGLSHSGWKGTVARMGAVTIQKMQEVYGCCPENIIACVGPSICADCYEVGEDVAEQFQKNFSEKQLSQILFHKPDGKYQLDLWKANTFILADAGIREEHMAVTNVCTCCNETLLFSHRATKGKRGNLAAFLSLSE